MLVGLIPIDRAAAYSQHDVHTLGRLLMRIGLRHLARLLMTRILTGLAALGSIAYTVPPRSRR
jgi:hypothetical protein